ncbi:MAG: Na/Pi cotransporter family protein, partial [Chitinophagales bacterium]
MQDFFENTAIGTLLQVIGSLGIFIFGMKIMSEGLQKLAGDGLRKLLKGMTSNRMLGILTGLGITVLIQSSSATTVMVVSFVNAGLLTLTESFGVIMGANIGTTITAWLLALFGFKMKINLFAIALIAIFFPFMFMKNEKMRNLSEFVLGFGILFIGLTFLKDAVPSPDESEWMNTLALTIASFKFKYAAIILFVFIGTLLTVIVQSSSAATAITLALLSAGIIPFDLACAMVLGENIGTTITANIAAMIGNVHAKRSARFHFLFNIFGVIWMLIVFIPFTGMIQKYTGIVYSSLTSSVGTGVIEGKDSVLNNIDLMSMALFHTTFNLLNVLMLFFFVPYISK